MSQTTVSNQDQLSTVRGIINSNAADAEARLLVAEGAATQTVNFTSTDTAAEIQALIDSIPSYIPSGITVTFQFGNGTYSSLESSLSFDFFGGGTIRIQGNLGETDASVKHVTQDVILDYTAEALTAIICKGSTVFEVYNIRVDNAAAQRCFQFGKVASFLLYYCSMKNASTASGGKGAYVINSHGVVRGCYFTSGQYAIEASNVSHVFSNDNDDITTSPTYGLRSSGAATIGKNSTQPTGATADESEASGGVIR